jgi:hypothetical protein
MYWRVSIVSYEISAYRTFSNISQFNKIITTTIFVAIKSNSTKDELCHLEHASSTASDQVLDEDLKRALEKTCNIKSPANKTQKKESWDICEPATVVICTAVDF